MISKNKLTNFQAGIKSNKIQNFWGTDGFATSNTKYKIFLMYEIIKGHWISALVTQIKEFYLCIHLKTPLYITVGP